MGVDPQGTLELPEGRGSGILDTDPPCSRINWVSFSGGTSFWQLSPRIVFQHSGKSLPGDSAQCNGPRTEAYPHLPAWRQRTYGDRDQVTPVFGRAVIS